MSRPLIYVCTPYADATPEGVAKNVAFAEETCRMVALAGGAPYAPHLLLTRFLADANPEERAAGIESGLRVLECADEVWARLPPWRDNQSVGMRAETATAMNLGVPVHFCSGEDAFLHHLQRLARGEIRTTGHDPRRL